VLPFINHWLSWCPGAGHLICVGRDRILGIGDTSFLNEELITLLNQKQVSTLAQASLARDTFTYAEVWQSSTELELTGKHATEWDNYTVALSGVGIAIKEFSKDIMIWIGGNASGRMTDKNFYNAILTTHGLPSLSEWKVKF
jgi:hypothetical protein